MVTVLKLGGSVITEKDRPETVDRPALEAAAAAVSRARRGGQQLVVVHGGGSFGHHHAARHGVSNTVGSHDAAGLLEIHRAMGELTDSVLDAFQQSDVDALPIRPLSVAHRKEGGNVEFPTGSVSGMLAEGFVPVVHGDIVVHTGEGCTVLSGDAIVVSLARSLDAERVGLCSTVPGVLDGSGSVVPEIDNYDDVAGVLGDSESTDVTGGMAGKVKQLLDLEVPAAIFDLDSLDTFFDSGRAGTVVR